MSKLISIVLPVFNEEKVISQLCKKLNEATSKLASYKFEIIMVENGSFDDSFKLLVNERKKNKLIKIIKIARNVGTDGALIAGLLFAKGDAAIVMMADLQEDPELINKFIKKWEKGYSIVYGIVKQRKSVHIVRRFETFIYYKLIKILTNDLIIENASDFRLMDKKVYKLVANLPEHNKFFRGLVSWTGYKQIGIPFNRAPRYAGKSKAYFTTVMRVALNGIFSFSTIIFFIPALFSLISFVFFMILIYFKQNLIAFEFLISTFLFFSLALIMEYIRRIFIETANRPQFIISEKIGF